jgi:hypothetical protein
MNQRGRHTANGKSFILLFLTFKYRNDVHSANRAGNDVRLLWDNANLSITNTSQQVHGSLQSSGTYRSSSFFITSTTSVGRFCMLLRLRSIVTPGFKSLLTTLASATCVSFSSKALRIACRTRAITAADVGADVDRDEFDGTDRIMLLGSGGSGGGLGMFGGAPTGRLPWAGLSGNPLPVDCVAAPNGPEGLSMAMEEKDGRGRL